MNNLPSHSATDMLQVGHWLQYSGSLFEITAWDAKNPLEMEVREAGSETRRSFTLLELFTPDAAVRFAPTKAVLIAQTAQTKTCPEVVNAASLPTHLLQRAENIIATVEAVQNGIDRTRQRQHLSGETFSLTEATRQACQELPTPISLSGYYKYRKLYRAHGADRARLAAALRRTTFGKSRIDPNAQHFVDTIIRRFYRSNPPLRAQTVYALGQQLWHHNRRWWLNYQQEAGQDCSDLIDRLLDARQEIDSLLADPKQGSRLTQIQLPSRSWFYGYVSWFSTQPGEGAQTYIARHGKADWEANFLLFDRFSQTATLPLQYVFADHYKLDVLHVDDEYREPLGRLWLTALIDAFSRTVLGFFLAYEDPNIESIQGALQHAIWPKINLETLGIDLPWVCFGVPQKLSLDNAWAHHSYSLEDLGRSLAAGGLYTQMELVFRPPYQARYGALIERLFGNLAGQLQERLPGAVLKPDQRHWHNSSQGACLLYRDLLLLITQLVVYYLHTP
nr:hypothetical protein [Chloroflexota bacterium]